MSSSPRVSVILVNYNGYDDTVECVKSLKKSDYDNFDIIVVENGSRDYDKIADDEYLKENATVILSKENGGFSAGNNIGIEHARKSKSDYVFLLNNDTTIEPNAIKLLVSKAESESSLGIVTGNIYFYSIPDKLWYTNGSYNYKSGRTDTLNQSNVKTTFVCGCMMMIKMDVVNNIGVLSDDFFLYSEDTEYSLRAIKNGWNLAWIPEAKVYHKISASTVENSDFQQYYMIRNNLLIVKMYGTNKLYGYIYRLYQSLKAIKNGNCTFKALLWAYTDFIKEEFGKSNRF